MTHPSAIAWKLVNDPNVDANASVFLETVTALVKEGEKTKQADLEKETSRINKDKSLLDLEVERERTSQLKLRLQLLKWSPRQPHLQQLMLLKTKGARIVLPAHNRYPDSLATNLFPQMLLFSIAAAQTNFPATLKVADEIFFVKDISESDQPQNTHHG